MVLGMFRLDRDYSGTDVGEKAMGLKGKANPSIPITVDRSDRR